jgi:hypothetical protein
VERSVHGRRRVAQRVLRSRSFSKPDLGPGGIVAACSPLYLNSRGPQLGLSFLLAAHATFTLYSLLACGFTAEATSWRLAAPRD